jgi:hypothetical protein
MWPDTQVVLSLGPRRRVRNTVGACKVIGIPPRRRLRAWVTDVNHLPEDERWRVASRPALASDRAN